MVNKSVVFFLGLCPVIPLVAHFAEGLIFIAEFWLLLAVGIVSKMLIAYFKIDKFSQIILFLDIILATALYAQIVGAIFPVMAISLERYIYMVGFSYILIISIGMYDSSQYPFEMPILYSILLAVISILRELVCSVRFLYLLAPASSVLRLSRSLYRLSFWGAAPAFL